MSELHGLSEVGKWINQAIRNELHSLPVACLPVGLHHHSLPCQLRHSGSLGVFDESCRGGDQLRQPRQLVRNTSPFGVEDPSRNTDSRFSPLHDSGENLGQKRLRRSSPSDPGVTTPLGRICHRIQLGTLFRPQSSTELPYLLRPLVATSSVEARYDHIHYSQHMLALSISRKFSHSLLKLGTSSFGTLQTDKCGI